MHPFLTCSSSLFSISKSIISSRSWRHLVCTIIVGSEISLVEFWDQLPHTLLEVCSTHKDKVEIKCMGSVGGKTPTEPNLCLFFSLALGTSNLVIVDVMYIHSYNMGDKI